MKAHPYAEILPLLEGQPFDELVADIKANGLLQPITVHEGKVLDGRNRWNACKAAGVEPRFVEYKGGDPLGFVLSLNVQRRHLDSSQRAMIAARVANLDHGGDRQAAKLLLGVSQAEAGAKLNVSERTVRPAVVVRDHATPELVRAVEQGRIPVSVAEGLARSPEAVQLSAVADPARAHVLVKQQRRRVRESSLAGKQLSWGRQEIYGVIYADPPWRFEPYSRDTGLDRDASNHYPVMGHSSIVSLDVGSIAADDCALFLWATAPMLPQALEVMSAWGFSYRSNFIWAKDRAGTGYWSRNQHEQLLVGVRGDIPAPAPGQQWSSLINAPVREHSRKPDAFAEMIGQLFPNLMKIELFARGKARPGWRAWGTEAEVEAGEP
jgi:N6-adenosine-specific RNA methylase IME4/ParB-like chromosome segregation protein Spo0J